MTNGPNDEKTNPFEKKYLATHHKKKKKMNKHPGFKAVSKSIQGQGYSTQQANAILASKTMHASANAKKANPRLNRVAAAQRRIKKNGYKA